MIYPAILPQISNDPEISCIKFLLYLIDFWILPPEQHLWHLQTIYRHILSILLIDYFLLLFVQHFGYELIDWFQHTTIPDSTAGISVHPLLPDTILPVHRTDVRHTADIMDFHSHLQMHLQSVIKSASPLVSGLLTSCTGTVLLLTCCWQHYICYWYFIGIFICLPYTPDLLKPSFILLYLKRHFFHALWDL